VGDILVIEMDQGEDFVGQLFWSSEYNQPIPVTDPVLMDVKDSNGQIAMRFSDTTDPTTDPHIEISGYVGYFQISCPASFTRLLVPGRYAFDLFASVANSAPPFAAQLKKVVDGFVDISARTSHVEDIQSAVDALATGP
jgi:hypothetical protein